MAGDGKGSETPRDYEREYVTPIRGTLRQRLGRDTSHGTVERFVVQLEYHHDGEWRPVVRYDHDGTGESEHAHDVTEDGLHIDIYRGGEQVATEFVTPPRPAHEALDLAEEHLSENLERFIKRYEQWHQIDQ